MEQTYVVTAVGTIEQSADTVFELIADPARQPEWDGNDNLVGSTSPRVRHVGDVFEMINTNGHVRENHVVEFTEGHLVAWRPSPMGEPQPGHLWRWEVASLSDHTCRVTHTYDWSQLTDETRMDRARSTTPDNLQASIDRLKALAES